MSPIRRLARQLRYLGEPLHRPHFLDRGWSSPGACWEIAERRLAEMERPYLAFTIRSDITLGPRFGSTDLVLRSLLNRPSVKQLAFTSPRRVLASLGLLAGAPDLHLARAFPAPTAVPEPSTS